MKKFVVIFISFASCFVSRSQTLNCNFKPPQFTVHFGTGNVNDPNNSDLINYRRVSYSCPSDGYYSFASYTSGCFNDDWHTIPEDHTAGDVGGNMLLVNAGRQGNVFLCMPVSRLNSNTTYELGVWLLNLCKPTKKCPFPLLPNLNIRLETPGGTTIANIVTGELPRFDDPRWIQHRAYFTTPAAASPLMLVMTDNVPSGCGNDFAVDDITFRECVRQDPPATTAPKKIPATKQAAVTKSLPKKLTAAPEKKIGPVQTIRLEQDTAAKKISEVKPTQNIIPSAPLVLKTRENALAKEIETDAGEIKIDIYDNGEIDGDTVSIYHNNTLIRSRMRLSQKPISLTIALNPSQSHHEIIMVAENLGSIPPNTSVMIITTASKRYQVFISSNEQKNAKVVFDLKK